MRISWRVSVDLSEALPCPSARHPLSQFQGHFEHRKVRCFGDVEMSPSNGELRFGSCEILFLIASRIGKFRNCRLSLILLVYKG